MKVMNPRLVRMARSFDHIWSLLAFTRRFWLPRLCNTAPSEPLSILVLELHLIGDAVMLLPFLVALRRRYPTARITVVTGSWNNPVFAGESTLDSIINFEAPWVSGQGVWASLLALSALSRKLRTHRWDIGIDMRGDIRNILILFFAGCLQRIGFDFTGGAKLLTCVVPDDGRLDSLLGHHERLADAIDAFDGKPFVPQLLLPRGDFSSEQKIENYVGFHFGASLPLRRLPIEEAVSLVKHFLAAFDGRAILFKAPDMGSYVTELLACLNDEFRARVEIWSGDLRGFMIVSSRARILYAMDSGPAHIGAATGRPTVVIFGPNRSAFTAPRGAKVSCVELKLPLPCQPCDQRRCVHTSTPQACLRGLVPDAVDAGLKLLSWDTSIPD